MKDLTPIETKYNNRLYRSRLEARWAVFFDAIGIKFEYEYEGYELSNGQWYLPDFFLPTFDGGLHAEVKPEGGDFFKAKMFCQTYGERIWYCEGAPTRAVYKIFVGEGCKGLEHAWGTFECGIPNWDQAYDENRMFSQPCCFKACSEGNACRSEYPVLLASKEDEWQFDNCDCDGLVIEAIQKSLSYRF